MLKLADISVPTLTQPEQTSIITRINIPIDTKRLKIESQTFPKWYKNIKREDLEYIEVRKQLNGQTLSDSDESTKRRENHLQEIIKTVKIICLNDDLQNKVIEPLPNYDLLKSLYLAVATNWTAKNSKRTLQSICKTSKLEDLTLILQEKMTSNPRSSIKSNLLTFKNIYLETGKLLSQSPHLKVLDLRFGNCIGTCYILQPLIQGLRKTWLLEDMTLKFDSCCVGDEFIQKFARLAKTKLWNLRKIYIRFENDWTLVNAGYSTLSRSFSSSRHLESLNLLFNGSTNLKDEKVEFIQGNLSQLSNLNMVSLSLDDCNKLNNEYGKFVIQSLGNPMDLRSFTMIFHEWDDDSLTFEKNYFGLMKSLEHLKLDLSHSNIRNTGLRDLVISLKGSTTIQSIDFNFA